MLRSAFLALVTLAVAIGGGAASVWWTLEHGVRAPAGWAVHADANAAGTNPYVRAQLARSGQLTLGRAEGLSFVAQTDSTGEPLLGNCHYRLDGPVPTSRFWTLWAAGPTLTPLPGRGRRPSSLHAWQSLRPADPAAMQATASSWPQAGNWLLIGAPSPFTLVLTFYDTPAAGFRSAAGPALPEIVRTGCGA